MSFRSAETKRVQRNLVALKRTIIDTAPERSLAFLLDADRLSDLRPGFEQAAATQIKNGVAWALGNDVTTGVRALSGCGFGLTPSGDDFICGMLIGLHFLRRSFGRRLASQIAAVRSAAKTENLLSAAFLEMAAQGRLFYRMKNMLQAIVYGAETEVKQAAGKLFCVGETSGADVATGFLMTVETSL